MKYCFFSVSERATLQSTTLQTGWYYVIKTSYCSIRLCYILNHIMNVMTSIDPTNCLGGSNILISGLEHP